MNKKDSTDLLFDVIMVLIWIVLSIVFIPGVFLLNGYVIMVLWGWFIVPLGIIALSLPMAMGISLLVSYMNFQHSDFFEKHKNDSSSHKIQRFVSICIGRPIMTLGLGYIIHLFM